MATPEPTADETVVVRPKLTPRGCAWRLGCLIVWFPLIMLPLFLLVLASQGEIALWHGADFPDGEEHPFLQAKLLMDIDTRGLNVTRSYISISSADGAAVCVQTHVRFVLWQGEGEPVDYCDCYARDAAGTGWAHQERAAGTCGPPG